MNIIEIDPGLTENPPGSSIPIMQRVDALAAIRTELRNHCFSRYVNSNVPFPFMSTPCVSPMHCEFVSPFVAAHQKNNNKSWLCPTHDNQAREPRCILDVSHSIMELCPVREGD